MDFNQIINLYGNKIFKYCFHMLRHREEAEDAAQEVFTKAYEQYGSIKDHQAVSSWLYKTAYHHCLNIIRRKKLISFVSIFDNSILDDMTQMKYEISVDANLTTILNRLSPSDRTIIFLRVLEDKSHEEIADIMNLSITAARKQYERARNKVRKIIDAESGEVIHEKISII